VRCSITIWNLSQYEPVRFTTKHLLTSEEGKVQFILSDSEGVSLHMSYTLRRTVWEIIRVLEMETQSPVQHRAQKIETESHKSTQLRKLHDVENEKQKHENDEKRWDAPRKQKKNHPGEAASTLWLVRKWETSRDDF
jgi:hypothetical protein